jgi:hypothetical protein
MGIQVRDLTFNQVFNAAEDLFELFQVAQFIKSTLSL